MAKTKPNQKQDRKKAELEQDSKLNRARIAYLNEYHPLMDAIKEHGGEEWIYSQVNDINNLVISGQTAAELRELHSTKIGREKFTPSQYAELATLQKLERCAIQVSECKGNTRINAKVNEVCQAWDELKKRFGVN